MQDRSFSVAAARHPEVEGAAGVHHRDAEVASVCMARWPGGIGEEPLFEA